MFNKTSNDAGLLTSIPRQEYSGFGSSMHNTDKPEIGLTQSILNRQQEMDNRDPFEMLKQMMDTNKFHNNFKPKE